MNILHRLEQVKNDPSSPAAIELQLLLNEAASVSSTSSSFPTPPQFCKKVTQAIDVISRSLLLYPSRESSSPSTTTNITTTTTTTASHREKRQRIALSFNGGKDCTVVLHLLLAALATNNDNDPATSLIHNVLPFYFSTPDVFAEELEFVKRTANQFFGGEHHLLNIPNVSNEEGVTTLVAQYGIKAFLMGTRATDPDGRWLNGVFWPSSKGWCPFMRINPCLDWNYMEVWIFLRFFNIDYCSLYDAGYTSIGSKSTSMPNPTLQKEGKGGTEEEDDCFHPAYMLADETQERAGRVPKKRKK